VADSAFSLWRFTAYCFWILFWTMIRQAKSEPCRYLIYKSKGPSFWSEGHGKEKITFKDVAGLKEAKEELVEIVTS